MLSFLALLLCIAPKAQSQNQDITYKGKYLCINSQPFFPIGLYHLPDKRKDDAIWKEISDAGFNFLLSDEPGKYGIYVSRKIPWTSINGKKVNYMETYKHPSLHHKLKSFIETNESDTSVICWHAPDEPSWFGPSGEVLRQGYNLIERYSNKPVWLNIGPSFFERINYNEPGEYVGALDVLSMDIYPFPDGERKKGQAWNMDANQVGINTRGLIDLVSINQIQEKPVWMVLQGFGWGEFDVFDNPKTFVPPTKHELRFTYYDAIVNGATGVLSYGPFTTKSEVNAQFWTDLKSMTSELQRHYDFLTCPWVLHQNKLAVATAYGETADPIKYLMKIVNNKVVILAVNTSNRSHKNVTFSVFPDYTGMLTKVNVLEENRQIKVENRHKWTDSFAPYEVHLYETDIYYDHLKRYIEKPE